MNIEAYEKKLQRKKTYLFELIRGISIEAS